MAISRIDGKVERRNDGFLKVASPSPSRPPVSCHLRQSVVNAGVFWKGRGFLEQHPLCSVRGRGRGETQWGDSRYLRGSRHPASWQTPGSLGLRTARASCACTCHPGPGCSAASRWTWPPADAGRAGSPAGRCDIWSLRIGNRRPGRLCSPALSARREMPTQSLTCPRAVQVASAPEMTGPDAASVHRGDRRVRSCLFCVCSACPGLSRCLRESRP